MLSRHIATLILAALAATGIARGQSPAELIGADGSRQQAIFQSAQSDQWIFLIDEQQATIKPAALVSWGRPVDVPGQSRIEATDAAQVYLTDGGLLQADIIDCNGEDLLVDSASFGQMKLPLSAINSVLLRAPSAATRRDARAETLRAQAPAKENDGMLLENGDILWGTLKTIKSGKIEFTAQGSTHTVPAAKVSAISINAALQSKKVPSGLRFIVALADGSHVRATSLTSDGQQAHLETTAGAWDVDHRKIVFLQTLGGQVRYLSDLKPSDYRHIPYLDMSWNYALDRNVLGMPLRSGGRRYFKGIGMHSTSRLTFDLDATYQRLEGTVALDDSVGAGGSVTFRVFLDGSEAYKSPLVAGSVPKLKSGEHFSLDVSAARRVSLVVDFGEGGDVLDRANWLDLRLVNLAK